MLFYSFIVIDDSSKNLLTAISILRIFKSVLGLFSIFWEDNYCYLYFKIWVLINKSEFKLPDITKISEDESGVVANRQRHESDHYYGNLVNSWWGKSSYPNLSLFLWDYLNDCCCVWMAEQRTTLIRTRDLLQKSGSQEQEIPVPCAKFWLKITSLVTCLVQGPDIE